MRRMLRWSAILLATFTLILLVVGALGYRLLATTGGSEWLLNKLLANTQAIELRWRSIDGSLIGGLQFENLDLVAGETRVAAETLVGQWSLLGLLTGKFTLDELNVRGLRIELPPPGPESTESPAQWPAISLPIGVQLTSARIEDLLLVTPEGEQPIQAIELSASMRGERLRIDRLRVQRDPQSVEVAGRIQLQPPYALDLNVIWAASLALENDSLALAGEGRLRGDLASLVLEHQLQSPLAVTTSAQLETGFDPAQPGLNFAKFFGRMQSQWTLDDWTIPGSGYSLTSSGRVQIEGSLAEASIESDLDLHIPEIEGLPRQALSLSARLGPEALTFDQIALESGMGRVQGEGSIAWADALNWAFHIDAQALDPGRLWPDFPGEIHAQLRHEGALVAGELSAQLDILGLSGSLRDFRLNGGGHLDYRDGEILARELRVKSGDNQLQIDGRLNGEGNIGWQLRANNLAQLHPDLGGQLASSGTLQGSVDRLLINARLSGTELRFQTYSAGSAEISLSGFSLNRTSGGAQSLTATLEDVDLAGQSSIDLALKLQGDLQSHSYQLDASQDALAVALSGEGAYADTRWVSELRALTANLEFAGDWELQQPVQLTLAAESFEAEPLCLRQNGSSLCAQLNWSAAAGIGLQAQVDDLQMSLLNHWLPPQARFAGALGGDVALSGTPGQLQGQGRLSAQSLLLSITQLDETEFHEFRDTRLVGEFSDGEVQLNLDSRLAETGRLSGKLNIGLNATDMPIDGGLEASFSQLNWLDPFLPQLSDLEGRTDIDVLVGGTARAPELSGRVQVEELSAFVPQAGISLANGRVDLAHRGGARWDLDASLDSGAGSLSVAGTLDFPGLDNWQGQLRISGQDFTAYELNASRVNLSPDLNLELSPARLSLRGDIRVPSADFVVQSLPESAVQLSSDEVIVGGSESADAGDPEAMAIYADVNLLLGDEVMFSGFNIQGRLRGQLRLRESPERSLRVDGNIEIVEGMYAAYGQELKIDPGQLVFTGPPENPSIHARASRRVGDTLVGVQLGGTVENLSSSLYSSPGMPQTEALALLITGKPLSSASSDDGDRLVGALTSLGISQSGMLTESLQNTLNLDVLEISAAEDLEESSLTIGKYLSPKVFISYAQDILTPNSSVSLDYILSDKLKIKAKSGAEQSMDIFYRFER